MKRNIIYFMLLLTAVLILIVMNISIGSVHISIHEIIRIVTDGTTNSTNSSILFEIRLPRIVSAVMLGGGLSLSGYMLQTFFHNPIAGPFVLGISSGAKLMTAGLMVLSAEIGYYITSFQIIIASLTGALLVTLAVLTVSSRVKNMAVLIVCGVMTGYVCSAITELLISIADDSNIVNLHSWSQGSFSATRWTDVIIFSPLVIFCLILSLIMSKKMEAFSYGEDYAVSVGMNVKLFKMMLIMLSSLLSAIVTAYAGPVSFVGIAVPHVMREIFHTDRPVLILPAAFVGGSLFCLLSDLIARCLFAPTELSISTITAIFGAPVVVSILLKKKSN